MSDDIDALELMTWIESGQAYESSDDEEASRDG